MSLATCVQFPVGKTVLGDSGFMYESRSMCMLMASTRSWAQVNFGIWEKAFHLESIGQSRGCLLWHFLSVAVPTAELGRWATCC